MSRPESSGIRSSVGVIGLTIIAGCDAVATGEVGFCDDAAVAETPPVTCGVALVDDECSVGAVGAAVLLSVRGRTHTRVTAIAAATNTDTTSATRLRPGARPWSNAEDQGQGAEDAGQHPVDLLAGDRTRVNRRHDAQTWTEVRARLLGPPRRPTGGVAVAGRGHAVRRVSGVVVVHHPDRGLPVLEDQVDACVHDRVHHCVVSRLVAGERRDDVAVQVVHQAGHLGVGAG